VIKPLRISEIGLSVPDVLAFTTTLTPSLGPIAVVELPSGEEVAGADRELSSQGGVTDSAGERRLC
jgi:hypothetical protein